MQVESASTPSFSGLSQEILRAVLVFVLLKAIESTARSIFLVGRSGRLSPHIWARTILLSEAWDVSAHLRLLVGKSRYDAAGGKKQIRHRPAFSNVLALYTFIAFVMGVEVVTLIGSLEVQSDVTASSVKLQFVHDGVQKGSSSIASNGCDWEQVTGKDFELMAPVGICWANGTSFTSDVVTSPLPLPSPSPTRSPFIYELYQKQHPSAIFFEESKQRATQKKEVTAVYLAAVIVTSSGLLNRVSLKIDAQEKVRETILSFSRTHDCSIGQTSSNLTIKDCNISFDEQIGNSGLLGLVSGGFRLTNGGSSPWEGNVLSAPNPKTNNNKIGVTTSPRVGWAVLLAVTAGAVTISFVLSFFVRNDNDVAMKMVMERTGGNFSGEDPTACVGEEVPLIYSLLEGGNRDAGVGHVGTTVPRGYVVVDSLQGATV